VHDDVVPPPSTSEWRISPGIGTPGSAGADRRLIEAHVETGSARSSAHRHLTS